MSKKSQNTQQNILKSARSLFLMSGFSGTSMNQIAQEAGVNKALLFHYFKSKEELWQHVKDDILGREIIQQFQNIQTDTFENFVTSMIDIRFEVYTQNPDLVKIMLWQRCSVDAQQIYGTQSLPTDMWTQHLKKFQDQEAISPAVDLKALLNIIFSLTSVPFIDDWEWIRNPDRQAAYKQIIQKTILEFVKN